MISKEYSLILLHQFLKIFNYFSEILCLIQF